ncbi:tyrosine-protein kinase Etk/Wzc [Pedobacter sp. CG_S7]|uniref:GumC family protein n=1 Tax=Pedobacter sp. CG_S7 TaxID=3143930 RepID=UPI00339666D8
MNSEEHLGKFDQGNTEDENINIGEVLNKYLYHWPVFLVCIIITLSIAFVYLRYTRPVYQINTSLLIKDDKKSATSADILSQLDLFGSSKVVENEVEILKSKALMRKVVDRLHLDVNYIAEGMVISTDLYEKKTIEFIAVKINPDFFNHEFEITFPNATQYVLKNNVTGKAIKGSYNQLQRNSFGVYKILKSPDFSNFNVPAVRVILNDPSLVTDSFLSRLTVAVAGKQSTVLNLTFQTTIPQQGKDVLNTLIQVYNEAALADKNKTTESTIRFVDERLGLINRELTDVEKDVESFKSSNGLTDISGEAALYLENVRVNDAQLNEVNIKLGAIQDIQRYVNANSTKEKLPSTFGIDDPVLLGQITQLSEFLLQRDKLLATTQEDNPLVAPLIKQIETTRASVISNVKNIASTLLTTKRELENNNAKYQVSIKKIPTQERQFVSIKRQQSIKETLYLYLLQKKEEAALSYASTLADSRVVDEAYSSNAPIKPKRQLTYLAALLLGLLLPLGYIYIRDLINNKVIKLSDVTKETPVSVLGEVVFEEGSEMIVVSTTSRKAIAEQFRSIRTNMQFIHGKQTNGQGNVTLFTSSMSGEGKTFVATNIAVALAISGRKTVLLELDLRKPKVSKYLDLANKIGLSNYLIGKADFAEIIQPSGIHENLFVIGSGPIPPNPSELLIQDEMEVLINYLKLNFDEILIDSPPIGLVTDAQILARLTDVTIYLVRHGVTFKGQLRQLEKLRLENKFPKLNVILNGVQLGGSYGYGYGYGYYSDDIKQHQVTLKSIGKDFFKRF